MSKLPLHHVTSNTVQILSANHSPPPEKFISCGDSFATINCPLPDAQWSKIKMPYCLPVFIKYSSVLIAKKKKVILMKQQAGGMHTAIYLLEPLYRGPNVPEAKVVLFFFLLCLTGQYKTFI